MENAIINNIEKLYQSHMLIAVLYVALIVGVSLITVSVIKCKLHHTKWKCITLVAFVVSASVVLLVSQIVAISPVYKDYTKQSYLVLENAKVIIKDGATGGIDSINYVTVDDG